MGNEMLPEVIARFLAEYEREFAHYEQVARLAEARMASLLESEGVRAIVTSRAKRVASLRRKLLQRYPSKKYGNRDEIFADIHDLVGIRIALYFPGQGDAVRKLIREHFIVEREKKFPESSRRVTNGYQPRFPGYCATHYHVRLCPDTLSPQQRHFARTRIEVQVASVLMHAWAEVEHDLVYKPFISGLSKQELAILDQINGLVLAGEMALENLEAVIGAKVAEMQREFASHYELAAYLHGWAKERFGEEPPMGRADVLYCLLDRIGLRTPAALAPYLDGIDLTQDTRPLSEQIVDKIIAGDTERYELFMQVMRQAGPRNPYNASDEVTVHRARGAALFGEFLSLWVALERGLLAGPLAGLSEPEQEELDWLRALRNRQVHDLELPSEESLAKASAIMRSLVEKVQESLPPELRAQIRELVARLDARGGLYPGSGQSR